MKRLGLAGCAFAALALVPALAADMSLKAPPPVAVFEWNGFYAGGNIGYSWGRSSHDWNIFAQGAGGGPLVTTCPPAGFAFCAAGSDSSRLNGVIGGLQAGYNWQSAGFLLGVEADFQVSDQGRGEVFSTRNATNGLFQGNPV